MVTAETCILLLLPIEKFHSVILPKNAGMLQQSIIHAFTYQMVTYRWLKTKECFKLFLALKVVMAERESNLPEVPNTVICHRNFDILEIWSLRTGG